VYSSTEEYVTNMQQTGGEIKLSDSSKATQMIFEDEETQQKVGLNQSDLMSNLGRIFAKYEIPFGLMNKLMELQTYDLMIFTVDDSGSMQSQTDTKDHILVDQLQDGKRLEEDYWKCLKFWRLFQHQELQFNS